MFFPYSLGDLYLEEAVCGSSSNFGRADYLPCKRDCLLVVGGIQFLAGKYTKKDFTKIY